MSFLRHQEIFPSDGGASPAANASAHRLDEFPAGYSSAGCSPALPASASPAGHQYAVMSSFRSSAFHRTANCVLTVCVSQGGKRTLRFKVETSSPQIEAGKDFTVSITITNPYDVQATFQRVTTRLPAKFKDMGAQYREWERERQFAKTQQAITKTLTAHYPELQAAKQIEVSLDSLFGKASFKLPGFHSSNDLIPGLLVAIPLSEQPPSIADGEPSVIRGALERVGKADDKKKGLAEALTENALEEMTKSRVPDANNVVLEPGNSFVIAFTLRTAEAMFFTPSTYNLHFQIEYIIDQKPNQDSVEYQLNVRAPLKALMCGAILGSLLGHLLLDSLDKGQGLFALLHHARTSRG